MDHHTVAAVSITGTCLDVLGSLYLAYDLLGGQHGPLRLLTRAVTYAVVFGLGYGLGLGLFLAWLPASPPVSLCRLSSVAHLVGWIITLCLGKDCFPPSGDSLSEPDCIGLWASDSPSHLPFSSPPAKSSPTLAECVLRSTMKRLAVH